MNIFYGILFFRYSSYYLQNIISYLRLQLMKKNELDVQIFKETFFTLCEK